MTRDELDAALIAAHKAGNGSEIARLYQIAGDAAEQTGAIEEACFFWVHAYVFALEAGIDMAQDARAQLVRYGREL